MVLRSSVHVDKNKRYFFTFPKPKGFGIFKQIANIDKQTAQQEIKVHDAEFQSAKSTFRTTLWLHNGVVPPVVLAVVLKYSSISYISIDRF